MQGGVFLFFLYLCYMNTKHRIGYIDSIKGFAIFLVVWGHCIQFFSTSNCFENIVFSTIYSFHMPLFMMLSGFFFIGSLKEYMKSFLIKTFRRLILPIILCGTLLSIYIDIMKGELQIIRILHSIWLQPLNQFWFLRDLFVCYIFAYFILKLFNNKLFAFGCSLIILFILPNKLWGGWMTAISPISYSTLYIFPYFWIGIFIKCYYNYFQNLRKQIFIISTIIFLVLIIFWDGNYTVYQSPVYPIYIYHNSFTFTLFQNWNITLYRLIIGLAGGLMIWSFFDYFSIFIKIIPVLECWGRNTLGIYIIQTFIIEYFMGKFIKIDIPILFYNFIITPIIAVILTILINFIVNQMKRNIITSYLIGFKE